MAGERGEWSGPLGPFLKTLPDTGGVSEWVEVRDDQAGRTRYLHQSGVVVQFSDAGHVQVDRGQTLQGLRIANGVEDWLVHVGYKLHAGLYGERFVTYRRTWRTTPSLA